MGEGKTAVSAVDCWTLALYYSQWDCNQGIQVIASYLLERMALVGREGMDTEPLEARVTWGIGAIFCCFSSMTDKST